MTVVQRLDEGKIFKKAEKGKVITEKKMVFKGKYMF